MEIDNILEECTTFYKNELLLKKKIKNKWKSNLKSLINVSGLFKWLDEHDSWCPIDIVEIIETDDTTSGYNSYQHIRILNDTNHTLYIKTNCDEIKNIDHYYVYQSCGYLGDDYSEYQ
jgi:hypothetical protein